MYRPLLIPLVAILCLAAVTPRMLTADDPRQRPNVLFVFTDDQRFDTIRALGNPEIETPTLDRLVQRGFTFTNAYCQGGMSPAVCSPSRTQLLTGRSVFRIPHPNKTKQYPRPTLGSVFRDAGYATLCISKPGNSFVAAHNHFEKVVHIPHSGAASNQKCTDAALEFLKAKPKDKPFFLYYATPLPHDPRTAEERFHKRYEPSQLTLSKNFMERHPFDNGAITIRDEKLAALPRDPAEMRRHLADYYATITSIDYHVGLLLEAIDALGERDNTIVVFSSDQGLAVGGRHGLMGKQNLYEHFKSPLIFAGPGIPHGQSDALVYLYDITPTLCQLCKIPVPGEFDGKNLVPILTGKSKSVRDALFAVYIHFQRMARDSRYKLIWYPKVEQYQLFDLQTDPDELQNLAGKPEFTERLNAMKTLLATLQDEFGDAGPRPK